MTEDTPMMTAIDDPAQHWANEMVSWWKLIAEDDAIFEAVLDACNNDSEIELQIFRQEQVNEAGLYLTLLMGCLGGIGNRVGLELLCKTIDALALELGGVCCV